MFTDIAQEQMLNEASLTALAFNDPQKLNELRGDLKRDRAPEESDTPHSQEEFERMMQRQ